MISLLKQKNMKKGVVNAFCTSHVFVTVRMI